MEIKLKIEIKHNKTTGDATTYCGYDFVPDDLETLKTMSESFIGQNITTVLNLAWDNFLNNYLKSKTKNGKQKIQKPSTDTSRT